MNEEKIRLQWRKATKKDKGVVLVDGKPMVLQESHGIPRGEGYGVYMRETDWEDILPTPNGKERG